MAKAFVELGQTADRGEVFGRGAKHRFQLLAGAVEVSGFDERASERHPRGKVCGMAQETGPAGFNRLVVAANPAELFRECRKRDRRRVRLDPAPQFLYARVFRHPRILLNNYLLRRRILTSSTVGDGQGNGTGY